MVLSSTDVVDCDIHNRVIILEQVFSSKYHCDHFTAPSFKTLQRPMYDGKMTGSEAQVVVLIVNYVDSNCKLRWRHYIVAGAMIWPRGYSLPT